MRYLLLIYENEADWAKLPEDEQGAIFGEYMAFTKAIVDSGNYRGGEALQPTMTATTVRVRNGRPVITDGPFAETREQLGGYYLIEAADLDQALSIAGRIPSVRSGCVEVRPIMETPSPESL